MSSSYLSVLRETCLQNVRLTCVSARVARMPHLFTQSIIFDFQKCNLPLAIPVWYMRFIIPYINMVQIHKFRFLLTGLSQKPVCITMPNVVEVAE